MCFALENVTGYTIKAWEIILLFSFLSKTKLDTNEVNLFKKFRYGICVEC